MRISLLLATRNRIDKLKQCLKSIVDTVSDISNIEIVFGYDVDENESLTTFLSFIDDNKNLDIIFQLIKFKPPYHLNDKYNYIGQMARNELLFSVANDLTFTTKNWDKMIINKFESLPKDKISCMWINDGLGSETLPRHYIIHKNYLQVTRNYACHLLKHYFSDNWIFDVSTKINRYEYLKDIIVEHSSPVLSNTPPDNMIIDEMNNWFYLDQNVYQGTQALRDLEITKLKHFIDNYK